MVVIAIFASCLVSSVQALRDVKEASSQCADNEFLSTLRLRHDWEGRLETDAQCREIWWREEGSKTPLSCEWLPSCDGFAGPPSQPNVYSAGIKVTRGEILLRCCSTVHGKCNPDITTPVPVIAGVGDASYKQSFRGFMKHRAVANEREQITTNVDIDRARVSQGNFEDSFQIRSRYCARRDEDEKEQKRSETKESSQQSGNSGSQGSGGSSGGGGGGGGGAECFPLDELVRTPSGLKRMEELRLGDSVLVLATNGLTFSPVTAFVHRDTSIEELEYVRVETESGMAIELSRKHLIYVHYGCDKQSSPRLPTMTAEMLGEFYFAERLLGGESDACLLVTNPSGHLVLDTIRSASSVKRIGRISPLTAEGTIFVGNILASTYTNVESQLLASVIWSWAEWLSGVMTRIPGLILSASGVADVAFLLNDLAGLVCPHSLYTWASLPQATIPL